MSMRIKEVYVMRPKRRHDAPQRVVTSALTHDPLYEMVFHDTYGKDVEDLQDEAFRFIKRIYEEEEYDHIALHPSGMVLAMTAFLAAWQEWQGVSKMIDRGLSILHQKGADEVWSEQVWWGRAIL